MSAEQVTQIPRCAECDARLLPAEKEHWRAHLGSDDLAEPPEVVFYCPDRAEQDFAGD